jgi:hypothetical protein
MAGFLSLDELFKGRLLSAPMTCSSAIATLSRIIVTAQVGVLGSGDLEFRDQTIGPGGQCL